MHHTPRIGLVGISHESNTFIATLATMEDFTNGHVFFGQEILTEYREAHHEIGGMIEVLEKEDVSLVPIMYAEATPNGKIQGETGEKLVKRLVDEVKKHLPIDGILVVPHGAAVSESHDDFDGYWLSKLRNIAGPIPIIGTLDLHANVSKQMVSNTDALIAYKTNPHLDQREVGGEAAALMINTLQGAVKPLQKLFSPNVAISIEQQHTSSEPCLSLYRMAQELGNSEDVLSVSILLGFPYADVPEMGSSILVVADGAHQPAERIGELLSNYIFSRRHQFDGPKSSIEDVMPTLDDMTKPILLLDMGDNVGGGSPGDGTLLLKALEEMSGLRSFVCLNDPKAVLELKGLHRNDTCTLALGAKIDRLHGEALQEEVKILATSNGKFSATTPHHGGQVHFDMGETAVVETKNGSVLMLTSRRTPPFSLEQLLQSDIDPKEFDVIVAKGVQAPIAAYGHLCPSIIRVNTPGITVADMKQLNYTKRRKPLFPFEN